jgi:hypothetical protein
LKSLCTALHLTALGIWAGVVGLSAATAAVAFPAMRDLGVRVTSIAEPFQKDAYRFAAGAIAGKVFLIADAVAFACSLIACITLLVLVLRGHVARRPATYFRGLALGVALASLAAIMFVVTPGITAGAKGHLDAARAGDEKAAAMHRQAVDDLHPISSKLLGVEVAAVLTALLMGGWAAGASSSAPAEGRAAGSVYPEPALRRNG